MGFLSQLQCNGTQLLSKAQRDFQLHSLDTGWHKSTTEIYFRTPFRFLGREGSMVCIWEIIKEGSAEGTVLTAFASQLSWKPLARGTINQLHFTHTFRFLNTISEENFTYLNPFLHILPARGSSAKQDIFHSLLCSLFSSELNLLKNFLPHSSMVVSCDSCLVFFPQQRPEGLPTLFSSPAIFPCHPPPQLLRSLTELPWQSGDSSSQILVHCSDRHGFRVSHSNLTSVTLCSLHDPRQARVSWNPDLLLGGGGNGNSLF